MEIKVYLASTCYNRGDMVERLTTGKIEFEGKGKLKIKAHGVEITLTEQAAPRKILDKGNPDKKRELNFPKGTIESLRPLLRSLPNADISDDADPYWMGVDKMASMSPKDAANKLKRAGVGHVEAARMLVVSDPLVNTGLAHNNFTREDVEVKISEVANLLLPFFQNKIRKYK